MKASCLLLIVLFSSLAMDVNAQDSLDVFVRDTTKKEVIKKLGITLSQTFGLKPYTPMEKPKVALVRSLFLPGWGQYTNKDYWKLPLVYAAAGAGYIFGINANQKRFIAYRLAQEKVVAFEKGNVFINDVSTIGDAVYLTVKSQDGAFDITTSKVYIKTDENIYYELEAINDDNGSKVSPFQTFNAVEATGVDEDLVRGPLQVERLESGTDQFRRYRDLSRIGFAVGWLLLAVEANVAGHMKTFDVSDDISFNLTPKTMITPQGFVPAIALNIKL